MPPRGHQDVVLADHGIALEALQVSAAATAAAAPPVLAVAAAAPATPTATAVVVPVPVPVLALVAAVLLGLLLTLLAVGLAGGGLLLPGGVLVPGAVGVPAVVAAVPVAAVAAVVPVAVGLRPLAIGLGTAISGRRSARGSERAPSPFGSDAGRVGWPSVSRGRRCRSSSAAATSSVRAGGGPLGARWPDEPFCADRMASMSWLLRIAPVPLRPSVLASCLSSGRTMLSRPEPDACGRRQPRRGRRSSLRRYRSTCLPYYDEHPCVLA